MSYSKLPLKDRLLSKAAWIDGCLIWQGTKHKRGFGRIRKNGKWTKAYQVSYEVHFGPIPEGMVVRHSCDNPACINPAHLSIGTQLDNVRDMYERGRQNIRRGEKASKAKLTETQVLEIRRRYIPRKYGHGAHALAREFGVTKQSIQAILRGDSWSHLL